MSIISAQAAEKGDTYDRQGFTEKDFDEYLAELTDGESPPRRSSMERSRAP